MRVRARQVNWNDVPAPIAPYTKESQTFLTRDREYEVHAIAVFAGFTNLQIIDDLGCPSWEASWLFDVVDGAVPSDWSCNLLHDEPSFLLGPEFITRDEYAYRAMVELDADQVDRFWKRVRDLAQNTVVDQ